MICGAASGQTLDAPTEVTADSLVVFDATDLPASAATWLLVNPPSPDAWRVSRDGSQMFFATPTAGRYFVVLALADTTDPERPTVALIQHTLTVRGTGPLPDPDDPIVPDPILPDGRFKLAAEAYRLAADMPARPKLADLIGVYRSLSSQIRAGGLSGEAAIGEALVSRLQTRLGADVATWQPWGRAVQARMQQLATDGLLKPDSSTDTATALEEIATGLEILSAQSATSASQEVE